MSKLVRFQVVFKTSSTFLSVRTGNEQYNQSICSEKFKDYEEALLLLPDVPWLSVCPSSSGRINRDLSKRGRQRQHEEARKMFLRNPRIFTLVTLYVSIFWTAGAMNVSSWNVGHVLKTAWKWSSWRLIWYQDETNFSFISHIHVRFLSCVMSLLLFCRRCRRRPWLFCLRFLFIHRY